MSYELNANEKALASSLTHAWNNYVGIISRLVLKICLVFFVLFVFVCLFFFKSVAQNTFGRLSLLVYVTFQVHG